MDLQVVAGVLKGNLLEMESFDEGSLLRLLEFEIPVTLEERALFGSIKMQ